MKSDLNFKRKEKRKLNIELRSYESDLLLACRSRNKQSTNEFKSDILCLRTRERIECCIEIFFPFFERARRLKSLIISCCDSQTQLTEVELMRCFGSHTKRKIFALQQAQEKREEGERKNKEANSTLFNLQGTKHRNYIIGAPSSKTARLRWFIVAIELASCAQKKRTLHQVIEFYGKLILFYFSFRFEKLLNWRYPSSSLLSSCNNKIHGILMVNLCLCARYLLDEYS